MYFFLYQDESSDSNYENGGNRAPRGNASSGNASGFQAEEAGVRAEGLLLTDLPESIQLDVFSRLSCSDLAIVGKCCKQLYRCILFSTAMTWSFYTDTCHLKDFQGFERVSSNPEIADIPLA